MNKLFSILLFILPASIFPLHFDPIVGPQMSMAQYAGKEILLVNIATGSDKAEQLSQLEDLQQHYKEDLVVIGFPSNSFNSEPNDDSVIAEICKNKYGVTFPLSKKTSINQPELGSIYEWLGSKALNGTFNGLVVGDFQKFLINKDGQLIGVFAPDVKPMDSLLTKTIEEIK